MANGLDRDRLDHLLAHEKVAQLRQRPELVGFAKKVRRTPCRLDDDASLFLREIRGSSNAVLRRQCRKPFGIKRFDDVADMRFRKVVLPADGRNFESLIASQNDLGTPHLDAVGSATNETLKPPPLGHADIAHV